MVTRLLSVAFVCVFNVAALAQLPSESFSPLNYFGRYHGFGYSDGYHACKDGHCNSDKGKRNGSIWKPWESMSSFYGSPTAPPSNRVVTQRATSRAPLYSQEYFVSPNFGPSIDVSPQSMYQALPQSLPNWPSTTQPSYESVPPAPGQSQPSPSDRGNLELPAPQKTEQMPPTPTAEPRDVSSNFYPLNLESNWRPTRFNPK